MAAPRRISKRVAVLAVGVLTLAACASGNPVSRSASRGTIDGVPLDTVRPTPTTTGDTGSTGAIGSSTGAPTGSAAPGSNPPNRGSGSTDAFGWKPAGENLESGRLEVPLDYADPAKGTIELAAVRHLATDAKHRIGTLLVNPGGPGVPGTALGLQAAFIYDPELLDRFDILGWDPRGTGDSTPAVDCTDDLDHFFGLDSSPDTAAEQQALVDVGTEFGADCEKQDGRLLPYIDTVSSARDMDAIRNALGEPKISYFGFSYGSELGATWATLFPATVRAMVIDGAVDPTESFLQQELEQATGFEATFDTFLAQCSADPTCAFHNGANAAGAYDTLAAEIDATPLPSEAGRTPVTDGVLETAVNQAMYSQSSWAALEKALADAQRGDGAGLLALYDQYFSIDGPGGTSDDNSIEAYFAILCLDSHGSTGPADLFSHEAEFAAAAPRLGRGWMAELVFCSVWPVPEVAPFTITGRGAGPIVVVGTTGDPATPLVSTKKMADTLEDGRLVVVSANQHTGYGVNACVNAAVDDYLVDPAKAPKDGLSCR
ncbi:MAG: alpha/beta hydrolase [Ilumatobacteraceae bacterium]